MNAISGANRDGATKIRCKGARANGDKLHDQQKGRHRPDASELRKRWLQYNTGQSHAYLAMMIATILQGFSMRPIMAFILLAVAGTTHAAPIKGLRFDHHDWMLACDNTRTCRAAGYQDDVGGNLPVSVLLTRKGGPRQPVSADAPPFKATLVTASGGDDDGREINSAHKGRGLGDCWSTASWGWDGRRFVQTDEATTGLCRLVAAGGAWLMPTLVTEVKP